MRVLLLENDVGNGPAFHFFRDAGHETEWASDIASAEKFLAVWKPDVLVADYKMDRGETSQALLERIKADERLKGMAVIVWTGLDPIPEALRGVADRVLQKPVDIEAMVKVCEWEAEKKKGGQL